MITALPCMPLQIGFEISKESKEELEEKHRKIVQDHLTQEVSLNFHQM